MISSLALTCCCSLFCPPNRSTKFDVYTGGVKKSLPKILCVCKRVCKYKSYHSVTAAARGAPRHDQRSFVLSATCTYLLFMYVGVVELLRNLPLYGGGFVLTANTR